MHLPVWGKVSVEDERSMATQKIRIRLKAYDSKLLDQSAGEIVETGPCRQLLTNPRHPYTKSLLAAVPTLRTDPSRPLAMVAGLPAESGLFSPHAE